jgi:hypothetical protein
VTSEPSAVPPARQARSGPAQYQLTIFLSYRREDTKYVAGRLHDRLVDRFGRGNVFMDVVSVEPGVDFGDSVERAVAASDVLIALIGPSWLSITGEGGGTRIDDPEDWVAREVVAALQRGIRVVPVLVDGAVMPRGPRLPPALRALAQRQAVHLRHESFEVDVAHLLTVLDRALRPAGDTVAAPDGTSPQAVPARRPIHLLRTQRPHVTGRDELLATMHSRLTGPGPAPRQLVLHGLGGVGKTTLAREYAHLHAADYNLVFEVSAENPAALSTGFAKLAHLLGVADESDTADPIDQVHAVFAGWPEPWLLLLDNAADADAVARAVPPAGIGHVLVTSRSAIWPQADSLWVSSLDRSVAAAFLVDRTDDQDAGAASLLAEELGALPLALGQAAAYVSATGLCLADYLGLLRDHRAATLRRGRPHSYDGSIATTWSLAFEKLAAEAPDAITLLRLLACWAADDIPVRLLLAPGDAAPGITELGGPVGALLDDPFAALDATAELRRYSLVDPGAPGTLSVHRLVQAVTLDQLPEADQRAWRAAAGALVAAALPDQPRHRENWPTFAALLPHVRAALDPAARGHARLAYYLESSGDHMTERLVREEIHRDAADRLGPDHPDTLRAQFWFVRSIGHAGDAVAARDAMAALVPELAAALGPADRFTLWARTVLADLTGTAGAQEECRDQLVAHLPVVRRALGDEHPVTLETWLEMAWWTGETGDPTAARRQYEQFLPIRERVLDPRDADTLWARDQYARWVGESGDPTAARDLCVGLVPDMDREFGPEHPGTLWARTNHAWFVGEAGDPSGARDLYRELVPVWLRVSGPEAHGTLVAQSNLAYWTGHAGDPAAARDLCTAILPVRRAAFGADHPETLLLVENIARWTGLAGDPAAARDQFAALLGGRERALGPEHRSTTVARVELERWTAAARTAREEGAR